MELTTLSYYARVFIRETKIQLPIKFKQHGAEGFQRAIGKPFGRLRRGEIACCIMTKKQLSKLFIID